MRETDVEPRRPTTDLEPETSINNGIDDGLIPPSDNPVNRQPTQPNTPTPRGGYPGGYLPIPSDKPVVGMKPGVRPLDVNTYATKKTVAQGMMDIALLTANANQLRYVLESGSTGGFYYYMNIVLISFSILLQLVIGILLIFMGRYNVTRDSHAQKANRINNLVVLGVFLITVINVFISAFGIEPMDDSDTSKTIEDSSYIHKEL